MFRWLGSRIIDTNFHKMDKKPTNSNDVMKWDWYKSLTTFQRSINTKTNKNGMTLSRVNSGTHENRNYSHDVDIQYMHLRYIDVSPGFLNNNFDFRVFHNLPWKTSYHLHLICVCVCVCIQCHFLPSTWLAHTNNELHLI